MHGEALCLQQQDRRRVLFHFRAMAFMAAPLVWAGWNGGRVRFWVFTANGGKEIFHLWKRAIS